MKPWTKAALAATLFLATLVVGVVCFSDDDTELQDGTDSDAKLKDVAADDTALRDLATGS
jgi:hypothetical protein